MEALKLAFDTTIVGALALPWLILIIDLFLTPKGSEKESIWSLLLSFLAPFKDQGDKATLAVAGVFLFAAAYVVGAAITRVSGDFFNDDDLWIPWARLPTEDNIRTDVYCDPVVRQFVRAGGSEAIVTTGHCQEAAGVRTLGTWKSGLKVQTGLYCEHEEKCTNGTSIVDRDTGENAKQMIQRTFYRQEAALLLAGDKTDRLNQLHSQDLVLRGAAFDGLITLILCLFAIGGESGRHPIWWVFPIVLLAAGSCVFVFIHNFEHGLDDPPFMEFTAIVLGLAGVCIRLRGSRGQAPYLAWFLTALLLTSFAGFGWWWSEVLYDRLVLYSFYAAIAK